MTPFMLPMIFTIALNAGVPTPAHSSSEEVSQNHATHLIQKAAYTTEEAWEEFHTAAIEGTLASPHIQVQIEGQLHEVRSLLMQSRIANRSQDYQAVQDITDKIMNITTNIIQASRERKQ